MKLWLCFATSDDCDSANVIIAKTQEEAKEKFEKELDDEGIWYTSVYASEIKEIEGYEIVVIPKRYYAKGSNYFN